MTKDCWLIIAIEDAKRELSSEPPKEPTEKAVKDHPPTFAHLRSAEKKIHMVRERLRGEDSISESVAALLDQI